MNFTVKDVVLVLLVFACKSLSAKFIAVQNVPQEYWIDQELDHFHNSPNQTWRMRYFANDEFHQDVGPMFIVVGGSQRITPYLLHTGYLHELAKNYSAYLFAIEHRFYGKSRPTDDLSTDNLKYLSTKQVLADIAHFIVKMKVIHPELRASKVFLTGCSYGGSLVVWMKHFYPELVTGGWASSAPLRAKFDFSEFLVYIGNAIRNFDQGQCYQKIEQGIDKIQKYLEVENYRKTIEILKLCDHVDVRNSFDLWSVFGNIISTFAEAIKNVKIPKVCEAIMSVEDDAEAIGNWVANNSRSFQNACLNVTHEIILDAKTNIYDFRGDRQLLYQRCNEFGWFQTTGSRQQPFGKQIRLFHFSLICSDTFGNEYTKEYIQSKINATNSIFEDFNNSTAKGVFLTYGEYDGWRELGIQKHDDQDDVSIIPESFQCEDVYNTENENLQNFKRKMTEFLRKLLK